MKHVQAADQQAVSSLNDRIITAAQAVPDLDCGDGVAESASERLMRRKKITPPEPAGSFVC